MLNNFGTIFGRNSAEIGLMALEFAHRLRIASGIQQLAWDDSKKSPVLMCAYFALITLVQAASETVGSIPINPFAAVVSFSE